MKGRSHRLQSHDLHEDWGDGSWTVDCVCGVNFDDGEEMVNCDECGVWVHTRCSRYVKGDELFTCDKCKSKNNRNNSEETEVAQLLVEMPLKPIKLESNYASNGPARCPFRLWTDRPMEERVHVQGIPGGDPALFSGLSSVFSPELWKCTGYVPKKFNFQYREFPFWDEKKTSDSSNEEENENTVDKDADVLFSLSKESVLTTPVAALIGMKGAYGEGGGDSRALSKDTKWEGVDGEVRRLQTGSKEERGLFQPVVIHSGKRKKEDLCTSKDQSGRKKARAAEREADAKRRGFLASRIAFTSTSDAKPLEFYGDRGAKSFENDGQGTKDKNLMDPGIEHESDSFVAVGKTKTENNFVIERSSDNLSSVASPHNFPIEAELKEKAGHEVPAVAERSPGVDDVAASAVEHNDGGRILIEQKVGNLPNDNLGNDVGDLAPSEVNLAVDKIISTAAEVMGNEINDNGGMVTSVQPNVQVEVDDHISKGLLNSQSSLCDAKEAGISNDNMSENSKMNDAVVGGSPSNDHNALEVDKISEAINDCHEDEVLELTDDHCQPKRELDVLEGSMPMNKCSSRPKHDLGYAEELLKSSETINSSSLPCQRKVVLCLGKPSSTSATVMVSQSSASENFRPADYLNSNCNTKQPVVSESISSGKKDRAATDVVREEDRHDMSRKTLKEHQKYSTNSSSKVSSKSSHASALKRINSDSKESVLKASSTQSSCETGGSLQNEYVLHSQNKGASNFPTRGEKFNLSNTQSSCKANQASSTNSTAPTNSATLSDEELALLLHQELNSSPRVPRVPRVRHAGSFPQLASPTATSMLIKCTSSSGGRDHSLVSRRKIKETSKDGFYRSQEPDREFKKKRVPYSPGQRTQDAGHTTDALSKREDNGSPTTVHSVKKNNPPASTSTANSGPSSSTEVNDHHLTSARNSPGHMSDEETGTVRVPIHRTLPGLINEIMSKGRRMTYEELCDAVLPHWHNLRKHNGERYAYSSPSQGVLDCLRNRHEWAQLVDRGPKTNSSRKRRKLDADESEDNDYGKGISGKEGEGKSLDSQREEFPKGKRKARKRRRLALQGRGIKDVRKRPKVDFLSDDDSGPFSNSSEDSLFSEGRHQGGGAGPVGSEDSASSDETDTT